MTRLLAGLLTALWLAACAASVPPMPEVAGGPVHQVRVLSNGWHTAIVLPRAEVAGTGLLPEAADFPDAAFLEFGWGDREYYAAEQATLGLTLRAALIPTPAVMHVAGRRSAPEPASGRDVVQVALGEAAFRSLVGAISATFRRPEGGRAEPLGPGLYRDSRFYDAHGAFHLFNTCNTWTARMLRQGGVDILPFGLMSAENVMTSVRKAAGVPPTR